MIVLRLVAKSWNDKTVTCNGFLVGREGGWESTVPVYKMKDQTQKKQNWKSELWVFVQFLKFGLIFVDLKSVLFLVGG